MPQLVQQLVEVVFDFALKKLVVDLPPEGAVTVVPMVHLPAVSERFELAVVQPEHRVVNPFVADAVVHVDPAG
jgi:hypothetical protein